MITELWDFGSFESQIIDRSLTPIGTKQNERLIGTIDHRMVGLENTNFSDFTSFFTEV